MDDPGVLMKIRVQKTLLFAPLTLLGYFIYCLYSLCAMLCHQRVVSGLQCPIQRCGLTSSRAPDDLVDQDVNVL